jgi:hypothetical protein
MALYGSPRRYYHRERLNARERGDYELEGVWRSKQERCTPATPLPALPYVAQLRAAGYDVLEDLVSDRSSADELELVYVAGLTPTEAREVLAALAKAVTLPIPLPLVTE